MTDIFRRLRLVQNAAACYFASGAKQLYIERYNSADEHWQSENVQRVLCMHIAFTATDIRKKDRKKESAGILRAI